MKLVETYELVCFGQSDKAALLMLCRVLIWLHVHVVAAAQTSTGFHHPLSPGLRHLPADAAAAIKEAPTEQLLNTSLVLSSFEHPVRASWCTCTYMRAVRPTGAVSCGMPTAHSHLTVRSPLARQAWGTERLECLVSKLRLGWPITVAVLGGSVSAGSSYRVMEKGRWLYHAKVNRALQALYPSTAATNGSGRLRVHNGAVPATGPAWFEHCVVSQLPMSHDAGFVEADLVVVEFSINLDHQPAAFERLLRKLLALRCRPGLPAILVLNLHVWQRADLTTGKLQRGKCMRLQKTRKMPAGLYVAPEESGSPLLRGVQAWEDEAEDQIARLCRHYGVPLVSMRGALLRAVKQDDSPHTRLTSFMHDCKHPNGQGHTYLAQAIVGRILAADTSDSARPRVACRALQRSAPSLPAPLHASGWPQPSSHCARGSDLPRYVHSSNGFELTDEGLDKYGLVATRSGSSVTLRLFNSSTLDDTFGKPSESVRKDGPGSAPRQCSDERDSSRAVKKAERLEQQEKATRLRRREQRQSSPLLQASGSVHQRTSRYCYERQAWCGNPQVAALCNATCGACSRSGGRELGLWLAYLHSHEHMGRARLGCSGVCACDAEIDAHNWIAKTSVTAVRLIRIARRQEAQVDADGAGHCLLTLSVIDGTSSGSHKFKVLGLLFGATLEDGAVSQPGTKLPFFWGGG